MCVVTLELLPVTLLWIAFLTSLCEVALLPPQWLCPSPLLLLCSPHGAASLWYLTVFGSYHFACRVIVSD